MDGTALFFWIGMAALLAVAVVLGRWQAEDLDRRLAETYGHRAVQRRVEASVRAPVSSRDTGPPDAVLPGAAERASA